MEAFIVFSFFTLAFAFVGFWLYALVEIIQRPSLNTAQKITWLLLVLLLPFVGTILYFSVGRAPRYLASAVVNEPEENEFV